MLNKDSVEISRAQPQFLFHPGKGKSRYPDINIAESTIFNWSDFHSLFFSSQLAAVESGSPLFGGIFGKNQNVAIKAL